MTSKTTRRATAREITRFLCIGGLATLLDLAVFRLALAAIPSKGLCFVIGFTVSVTARFAADKSFTFKANAGKTSRQFTLYVMSCCATLLIGLGVFNALLLLSFSPMWSKVISIPFVTVAGYLLFKFLVFKQRKDQGRFP
jgi:putative flippase GtrA